MEPDPLDPVWKALANPVRRKMLDLLRGEALTTGGLVGAFPELSRFAVMQHLDVLEDARLITVRRVGRQRFNYLNAVPIRQIYERWVSQYEGHWASALIALRDSLEDEEETEQKGGKKSKPKKKQTRKKAAERARTRAAKGKSGRSTGSSRRHRKGDSNE